MSRAKDCSLDPQRRQREHQASTLPRLWPSGDSALLIELSDVVDDLVLERVRKLDHDLNELGHPVLETVPAYCSVLVCYDALAASFSQMCGLVTPFLSSQGAPIRSPAGSGRLWEIPVAYGGEFGIDLERTADRVGLSPVEVVRRHSASVYTVSMIGFMPGFAYLRGLVPELALPRLESPRVSVPAGSITIAGAQAAVTSIAAPSGWHLLGRTPARLFDPNRDPVCLLSPGDGVTFTAIGYPDWHELDRAAQRGELIARQIGSRPGPPR